MTGPDLGTAFVQIVPSARGISGSISNVLGSEASAAGTSAGNTVAGKIKGAIAAAAIGEALKASILQGAELEQSLGGVETLFGKHANNVIKNSSQAYRTAGVSANTYMSTVTSFSASLLQSLSGDTKKASEYADRAMRDMSDNANKMGTDMELIVQSYQSFARGNFAMLDNLKLGYGGTKSEMERLIKDAAGMTDIQKKLGITVDENSMSFGNMVNAISVMQEHMGIADTTALEAEKTISGSFNSMKAAFQDFMGNLALGREIGPSMIALAETAGTFLFDNLMPSIGNIITSLPTAIYALIKEGLPKFFDSGITLVKGIADGILSGLPTVGDSFVTTVRGGLMSLTNNLPAALEKGVQFISKFATGILQNLPELIGSIGKVVQSLIGFIQENLPTIMHQGGILLANLAMGILQNLPEILSSIREVLRNIVTSLLQALPTLLTTGVQLVGGIASGLLQGIGEKLSSATAKVRDAIYKPIELARDKIKTAIDKIKSFFDITLKFKGIKLPHISMSWNKSGVIAQVAKLLGIPGVPKFSVNWYKTGGIFDDPSIIGVGEAGSEAVVPLDALWNKMDRFIKESMSSPTGTISEQQIKEMIKEGTSSLAGEIREALENVKVEHVTRLNGKVVAREITPLINTNLGRQSVLEERGL